MSKRKSGDADEQPRKTAAEHVADGTWTQLLDRLDERVEELAARVAALEAAAAPREAVPAVQ